MIFAVVNLAGYKLRNSTGSKGIIAFTGFILCTMALIVLIVEQYPSNKTGVITALSIILICFLIEWIYKKTDTLNQIKPTTGREHS